MKAAYYSKTGSPEVIQYGDLPDPVPTSEQVRIRVRFSSVNPIDTYYRSGAVAAKLPDPFVPGCDFAGEIESVGSGVKGWTVGERVWGSNQALLGRQGTSAEFACVDTKWIYRSPEGVSDEVLAAASLTGITAHLGLFDRANLKPNETVFVNGGTGGVGSMVVQMAKVIGAKVITTVGSPEKAALAKSFGADLVLNYHSDPIVESIKDFTSGKGVNVWFETQREPDLIRTVDLTASFGRIVLMAGRVAQPLFPVGPFYVKCQSIVGFAMFNVFAETQASAAADINHWLNNGNLKPLIGKCFDLASLAEAHQLQEDNTLQKKGTLQGKITIKIT
jgi:NADPH:quinone reductase